VSVIDVDDAVEIAVGVDKTCARRATGAIVCWGMGYFGDGLATVATPRPPTVVPGLSEVVQLSVGDAHVCVRQMSGQVLCWGGNGNGQIGDGTTMHRLVPTAVPNITDAVELSAGGSHTCVRRMTGAVLCWGGYPTHPQHNRTTPMPVPGLGTDVVEISAGGAHTCFRRAAGTVACWGVGTSGLLVHINASPSSLVLWEDVGLTDAVALGHGGNTDTGCARRQSGSVACWGRNVGPMPKDVAAP
jgi:hypothetical protein